MNPVLAPRSPTCPICRSVSSIEDVTLRLFNEDGTPVYRGRSAVAEYLTGIGIARERLTLMSWARAHQKHIEAWLQSPRALTPSEVEDGVRRIAHLGEQGAHWLDVQQTGMDLGMDALRDLRVRLEAGLLEPKEEVQLAKLGVTAATARGSMEARGKGVAGIDRLLKLAAGLGAE